VLSNLQHSFTQGFLVPLALDATVVLFTIGYFAACGLQWPALERAPRGG
jgi:hypothetical protein